jgi:hypothetical protein
MVQSIDKADGWMLEASPTSYQRNETRMAEFDPVTIVISRDEVEARDISSVLTILKSCIVSPEHARAYFEKIDVAFHGYNDDSRELFEIPEVRELRSRHAGHAYAARCDLSQAQPGGDDQRA